MSQATPRKFSEKIAILERKQNEEQEQFNSVMRDVRTITSSSRASSDANSPFTAPSSVGSDNPPPQPLSQSSHSQQPNSSYGPSSIDSSSGSKLSPEGPHPMTMNWNRAGGSLPNVHQMVQQQPVMAAALPCNNGAYGGGNWSPTWPLQMPVTASTNAALINNHVQQQHLRTRSPGAPHFHPYRAGPIPGGAPATNKHDQRVSHAETAVAHMNNNRRTTGPPTIMGVHLQPPDPSWSGRARSDPNIHTNTIMMLDPSMAATSAAGYNIYQGPAGMQWIPPNDVKMFNGPATAPSSAIPHSQAAFFPSYPLLASATAPLPTSLHHNSTLPNNSLNQQSSMYQQQQMPAQPHNQQLQQHRLPQQHHINTSSQSPSSSTVVLPPPSYGAEMGFSQQQQNYCGSQMLQQQNMQHRGTAGEVIYNNAGNDYFNSDQQMLLNNTHPQHQQMYIMKMASSCHTSPAGPFLVNNIGVMNQQQQLTAPVNMNQTHSAPTSPAQKVENLQTQQWPTTRHFSASPDGLEVPNICVTGTDGSLDVDCFQDLQDLRLDNETLQMLKEPGEQVDPACETQLLS